MELKHSHHCDKCCSVFFCYNVDLMLLGQDGVLLPQTQQKLRRRVVCRIVTGTSCAGVQSTKLPLQIEGAPNTRSVSGQNVYGSAMPTVEGIKNVLRHVGCAPSSDQQVGL